MTTLLRSGVLDAAKDLGFEDVHDQEASPAVAGSLDMQIDVHTDLASVEGIWRAFERDATGSVYQRYDWCRAWFDVFSANADIEPLIVVGHLHGRVALLLPLYRTSRALGTRVASFAGDDHANIRMPLITTDANDRFTLTQAAKSGSVLAAIVDTLQQGDHADSLALHSMPIMLDDEPNVLFSKLATSSDITLFSAGLMNDFEQLKTVRRPTKSQRKTRQNIKKLKRLGELDFVQVTDGDALDELLETFFQQKGDRLHGAGILSSFDLQANQAFIKHLAKTSLANSAGTLELFALTIDGKPIAIAGGGRHRDRFSMGINSMTSERVFAAQGPGRISIDHAVEMLCNQGMHTFDLGLGDNEYKRMWCDPVKLVDVDVPLSKKGTLYKLLANTKRSAIGVLRGSPRLKSLAHRARLEMQRLKAN